MLFANHAVNVERESRGLPAINSVWFWGEGPALKQLEKNYATVHANDAMSGLLRLESLVAEATSAPR